MDIHPFEPENLSAVLDLTLATFGPFYETSFRPAVGDIVFSHRHGNWRSDYRRQLAGLHDPGNGKFAAVAWMDDRIVGYIGWIITPAEQHGEIDILAVAKPFRRLGVAQKLAEHATDHMAANGMAVISVGTGGDDFHAPARAFYESLGFTPFPTVNYTKAV